MNARSSRHGSPAEGRRLSLPFGVIALVGIAGSALAAGFEPNDPYYFTDTPEGFPGQWHLNRQTTGALVDANLAGAWSLGSTGQGVTIGIVEHGVDHANLDLVTNSDRGRSWDVWGNDADPMQRTKAGEEHATQVAGVAVSRTGDGDAGVGGGILLRAPLLTMTGTINNAGGSSTNNGGTVKIYSLCGGQSVRGLVSTGRLVDRGILMEAPTL